MVSWRKLWTLGERQSIRFVTDKVILTTLMDACFGVGNVKKTLDLHEEMRNRGLEIQCGYSFGCGGVCEGSERVFF